MVFAFEAARDVIGGEEKENGHERGVLAAEDSGGGMEEISSLRAASLYGGSLAERWYAHSYDGARLFFVVEDAWAPMRGELTNVYRSVYLER